MAVHEVFNNPFHHVYAVGKQQGQPVAIALFAESLKASR